jgi:hypothetical protein
VRAHCSSRATRTCACSSLRCRRAGALVAQMHSLPATAALLELDFAVAGAHARVAAPTAPPPSHALPAPEPTPEPQSEAEALEAHTAVPAAHARAQAHRASRDRYSVRARLFLGGRRWRWRGATLLSRSQTRLCTSRRR